MIKIYDCEQGTQEWFKIKLGVPSASNFSKVMAAGKGYTRDNYLYRLAAEILTGKPQPTYTNADMERGKALEEEARNEYSFITGHKVSQVGFIKNGKIGCSPDGLIGKTGGVEIKCPIPAVHIQTVRRGGIPPEHYAQVQGSLMVSGRKWWDFFSYSPDIKKGRHFYKYRVTPDLGYFPLLKAELDKFLLELKSILKLMKGE